MGSSSQCVCVHVLVCTYMHKQRRYTCMYLFTCTGTNLHMCVCSQTYEQGEAKVFPPTCSSQPIVSGGKVVRRFCKWKLPRPTTGGEVQSGSYDSKQQLLSLI